MSKKTYIAGHRGLVGSAIQRRLQELEVPGLVLRSRDELDLLNQAATAKFFETEKVDQVYMAAARVGGIHANSTQQAQFLYENLMMASNVIHSAYLAGVKELLFLGSSCIYPKLAAQPITESSLLTGPLEPTNEGYAIAKIAGLKLCEHYNRQYGLQFISAMPTNLYGPGDNFHPENSHVIPGLLRRFHEAKLRSDKSVKIWGSGKPFREFLYVDDLAEALQIIMERYHEPETINVGTGEDCRISDLAKAISEVVGFNGDIQYDPTKPDGTPRKLLDISKIKSLGWTPKHGLREGLEKAYASMIKNVEFEV